MDKREDNLADKTSRLFAEYLVNLADKSYEFEKTRYEGFERLAGQLLTFVTILSVALVTPAPALFDYAATKSSSLCMCLAWEFFICITLLLIALGFVLVSLFRTKANVLDSPQKQLEYISRLLEECKSGEIDINLEFDIACNYTEALQIGYEAFLEKNKKMWNRLKASIVLIAVTCILIFVFGLFTITSMI